MPTPRSLSSRRVNVQEPKSSTTSESHDRYLDEDREGYFVDGVPIQISSLPLNLNGQKGNTVSPTEPSGMIRWETRIMSSRRSPWGMTDADHTPHTGWHNWKMPGLVRIPRQNSLHQWDRLPWGWIPLPQGIQYSFFEPTIEQLRRDPPIRQHVHDIFIYGILGYKVNV